MRILFIAPKYTGGIGGHAARVAEKLREHGFDIKLMHTPHIPINKLKNPSFAVLSSIKAIMGGDEYDIVPVSYKHLRAHETRGKSVRRIEREK